MEPNNSGLNTGLQNAKARIVDDNDDDDDENPPPLVPDDGSSMASPGGAPGMGGMADLLRGMGGGGGGMPDVASMLNNPQMMAMAQQLADLAQTNSIANRCRVMTLVGLQVLNASDAASTAWSNSAAVVCGTRESTVWVD